jgi:hypothetical protein
VGRHIQPDEHLNRRSAIFWEERNAWFSDSWDFKGARQTLVEEREAAKGPLKHANTPLGIKVVTSQETGLILPIAQNIVRRSDGQYLVEYADSENRSGGSQES